MSLRQLARVFIDTNTALHYKRPDQIDWCGLTASEQVVLIGTPILFRELEYQKVHNQSAKLRARASGYINWLVQFVDQPALLVRPQTSWHFIPTEPSIDFGSHSLLSSMADDQLIASVISYGSDSTGSVYVATADLGLRIKLKHHGISPLVLLEEHKLPDELDSQEKELQKLRQQLALQRSPKLVLLTEKDGDQHPMKIGRQVIVPSAPGMAQIVKDNPELTVEEPVQSKGEETLSSFVRLQRAAMLSALLTPERIEKYNQERTVFLRNYERYLEDLLVWEENDALTVELHLTLSNEGTAPAGDVDVMLDFPDDLVLIAEKGLPNRPEQPTPPQRPTGFDGLGSFGARAFNRDFLSHLHPHLEIADIDDSVSVNNEEHQIRYWTRNLKHGFEEKLEPIYFRFRNRDAVRPFQVNYRISAAELPREIEGKLNFVLI